MGDGSRSHAERAPRGSVRVALLLGALALAPRLGLILVSGGEYVIAKGAGDVWSYHLHAELLRSGWHAYWTTPLLVREPLYPAFMALAYMLPGDDVLGLQLAQAMLGTATVVLLYLGLAPQVRHGVAWISALLVALNPRFVQWVTFGYREHVVILLLAALVIVLLRAASRSTRGDRIALGFVLALLVHTDVRFLPLAALVPGLLWILCGTARRAALIGAQVGLVLLVLMLPYQVRCYAAAGRPVVVTERVLDRWLPLARNRATSEEPTVGRTSRQEWLAQWTERKRLELDTATVQERELFAAGGRPELRRLPTYGFMFREYWNIQPPAPAYRPYPDGRFVHRRTRLYYLSALLELGPFLLALLIAWRAPTAWEQRVFWALLAFLAAHAALHVAIHAMERYRVPMEVLTSVITAIGALNALELLSRRQARAVPLDERGPEPALQGLSLSDSAGPSARA